MAPNMTDRPDTNTANTTTQPHATPRRTCTANRHDGKPCMGPPVGGLDKCRMHAGVSTATAKARGQVLIELSRWGLDGHATMADAGEVLLKLVTQSAARVELYSHLLGQAYEAADSGASLDGVMRQGGVAALIGYRYGADREGNLYRVEEAVRGLARLEAEERDRCASFAAKAVAAGLAERQVRLAEQQGALIVAAVKGILEDLELTPVQQARVGEVVARRMREIAA
jgi:hypothetical protein